MTSDEWGDGVGSLSRLAPTPAYAMSILRDEYAPRILVCETPLGSITPLDDEVARCKAPSVRVVGEVFPDLEALPLPGTMGEHRPLPTRRHP